MWTKSPGKANMFIYDWGSPVSSESGWPALAFLGLKNPALLAAAPRKRLQPAVAGCIRQTQKLGKQNPEFNEIEEDSNNEKANTCVSGGRRVSSRSERGAGPREDGPAESAGDWARSGETRTKLGARKMGGGLSRRVRQGKMAHALSGHDRTYWGKPRPVPGRLRLHGRLGKGLYGAGKE